MLIHATKKLNGQYYRLLFLASEKVLHAIISNNDMLTSYLTIITLIIKRSGKKNMFLLLQPHQNRREINQSRHIVTNTIAITTVA